MLDNSIIRQKLKQKRRSLDDKLYKAMSLSCFQNLQPLLKEPSIQHIGLYISHNQEVDTHSIIEYLWQMNKHVYVPKCFNEGKMCFYEITSWQDVEVGKYGILEPKETQNEQVQFDVLVIPLLGFNKEGYRLGMGGGYYDRYLACHSSYSVGLAFSFQEVEFKKQPHDLRLNALITENGFMKVE